jgi:2-polyprenyl-6-methoxyphenol hydroxylase-like FAD-dependent oxidoreductase
MSSAAQRVCIIGGGFTGMSLSILLSRAGVEVDLIEIDPKWRTDGAGITYNGPALRSLEQLGVLDEYKQHGAITLGVEMYTANGILLKKIPTPPVPMSTVVGGGGIMRPTLAKILGDATKAAGTNVKLGVTFEEIVDGANDITVKLTDGSSKTYDLVVAADGVYSSVRKKYFPGAATPTYTGQGVFRAVVPRFGTEGPTMFLSNKGKAGFTPVSDDEMYLHYTHGDPEKSIIPEEQLLPMLKGLLEPFTADLMVKVREHLNENSQILYRPLEGHLMERPWYKGRLVLTGDVVHATTPHLASGAGMGHEDALVLAEELLKGGELNAALERFQNRRWPRCSMVVNNSKRLGDIEMHGGSPDEHGQVMALSMSALMAPI